jgi:hypothetical protein
MWRKGKKKRLCHKEGFQIFFHPGIPLDHNASWDVKDYPVSGPVSLIGLLIPVLGFPGMVYSRYFPFPSHF